MMKRLAPDQHQPRVPGAGRHARRRRGFVRVWAQVIIALCGVATIGLKLSPMLQDEPAATLAPVAVGTGAMGDEAAANPAPSPGPAPSSAASSASYIDSPPAAGPGPAARGLAPGVAPERSPGPAAGPAPRRAPSTFAAVEVRYVPAPAAAAGPATPDPTATTTRKPATAEAPPLPPAPIIPDTPADPPAPDHAHALRPDDDDTAAAAPAPPRTLGPTDAPAEMPRVPDPNPPAQPVDLVVIPPLGGPAAADTPAAGVLQAAGDPPPAEPPLAPPVVTGPDAPDTTHTPAAPDPPAVAAANPEADAAEPDEQPTTDAADTSGPDPATAADAPAPPKPAVEPVPEPAPAPAPAPAPSDFRLALAEPIDYAPPTQASAPDAPRTAPGSDPAPDLSPDADTPDPARPDRITNALGMTFSLIPAGEFTMGSPPSESGRDDDETPHRVVLTDSFYLAQTEVTQAQWHAVMGTTLRQQRHIGDSDDELDGIGDTHPMKFVTWFDAAEFCRKLGEMDGRLYRLPTEAEWEYACRAGTTTAYHTGKNLNPGAANFDGEIDRGRTVEAASFPPNAWGLHDMHGNVREWTADYYDDEFYESRAATFNPTGSVKGDERVVRGGSWNDDADEARSAHRDEQDPHDMSHTLGFRVVLVP